MQHLKRPFVENLVTALSHIFLPTGELFSALHVADLQKGCEHERQLSQDEHNLGELWQRSASGEMGPER